jgi:beta-1,4-mannosyl-glycoprotein beta-1,4-N-acetylglucosaminyltransferase
MKIYDCTTFYSEHMMMDVRFNVLNEFVHKFIVVESLYSHSGKKKKLNFDIKNYLKFKDKIIYLIIDKEPKDLIVNSPNIRQNEKRINSLKRIDLSYNHMISGISGATEDDLIILSDNDEIPNLNSELFKKTKKNIIIFKQLFFYYKFNLLYDRVPWFGSKACKKKYLKSFSWLKQIKNKKYPFWRFDTYFKSLKNINLQIVENGGWHFTNVNTPKEVFEKMKNFGHHDEFDASGLTVDDIKKKIINKKVFYNHLARQEANNKWNSEYELKKIDDNMLPKYLLDNRENFKEWFQ